MLSNFRKKILWGFLLFFTFTFSMNADEKALDAGAIQQSIEQTHKQDFPTPTVEPKLDNLPIELELTGVTFILNEVKFIGNTIVSNIDLNRSISSYLGHPIDFNQLQLLSNSIEILYRKNGYFARVILPEQELQNKKMTIVIEEALFGKTKIDGNITRINPRQIIDIINASQLSGELLKTKQLDRGLLLSSDVSGVGIEGMLIKGSTPKTIDLILKAYDKPLAFINLITDNGGPISTGENRFIANMGLQSPLKLGDTFSLTYLTTSGSEYFRSLYTLPICYNGLKVGFFASSLDYTLISSPFTALEANGDSSTKGIEFDYPFIREWDKNLYLSAKVENRHFKNSSLGEMVSNYSVTNYSLGGYGHFFDSFSSGGLNTVRVSLIVGNVDLSGSANQEIVATTNNAQGDFMKISYGLKREQKITNKLFLAFTLQGQATNDNLDSSEKFYLGGLNGVRAYPINEGGGSSGNLASIELGQTLPQHFIASTFFDYGDIKENANNNFIGGSNPNNYSLKGVGASLAWHPISTVNIKGSWATRIGTNPNQLSSGADQDGTKVKNRFWFTANVSF